jgi:signal transduction histidine kinase
VPVPPRVRRDLLRVAHEAMLNAVRHGAPRRIDVRLSFAEPGLTLSVRDDGRGFDPARSPGIDAGHFGLTGMRERAAALGTFTMSSQPGLGTSIEVTVAAKELRDA